MSLSNHTKLHPWSRRVQKGIYANFRTFDDGKVSKTHNEISNLDI